MEYNDKEFAGDQDDQQQTNAKTQPSATRVDDGDDIEEKDLEKTYLFGKGDFHPHPTEGTGAGGQDFGEQHQTPSGNDKNNPSRHAGDTNAYLSRTEPMEEHPENENFKVPEQQGSPDYANAQPQSSTEPKPDKVERGNGKNDRPDSQSPYREGKDSEQENIPGPQELPDQQKVGEDDEKGHIET